MEREKEMVWKPGILFDWLMLNSFEREMDGYTITKISY